MEHINFNNDEHPVHLVLVLLRKAQQCNADPKIIDMLLNRYNQELHITYWSIYKNQYLIQDSISGLLTDQSDDF